jgi:hypothetical protein
MLTTYPPELEEGDPSLMVIVRTQLADPSLQFDQIQRSLVGETAGGGHADCRLAGCWPRAVVTRQRPRPAEHDPEGDETTGSVQQLISSWSRVSVSKVE